MGKVSATKGFFQEVPVLGNQFHEDPSVQRVLRRKTATIQHS